MEYPLETLPRPSRMFMVRGRVRRRGTVDKLAELFAAALARVTFRVNNRYRPAYSIIFIIGIVFHTRESRRVTRRAAIMTFTSVFAIQMVSRRDIHYLERETFSPEEERAPPPQLHSYLRVMRAYCRGNS